MKQNIIKELAEVSNTDMKDRSPLKRSQKQPNTNKVGKKGHRRSSTRLLIKHSSFK